MTSGIWKNLTLYDEVGARWGEIAWVRGGYSNGQNRGKNCETNLRKKSRESVSGRRLKKKLGKI